MSSIPWPVQLAIAVGLFLAFDLLKAPGERHRWREYLFLAGCGVLTALFGVLVDLTTCRISPDYFLLGKGLGTGPEFRLAVAKLGAGAGFGAGVLGGGIVLLANRSPARTFRLFRCLWMPYVPAALCGVLAGGMLWLVPWYVHPTVAELLSPQEAHRFTVVWFIHIGVYAGGAAGLIPVMLKARQQPADSVPAPGNQQGATRQSAG